MIPYVGLVGFETNIKSLFDVNPVFHRPLKTSYATGSDYA